MISSLLEYCIHLLVLRGAWSRRLRKPGAWHRLDTRLCARVVLDESVRVQTLTYTRRVSLDKIDWLLVCMCARLGRTNSRSVWCSIHPRETSHTTSTWWLAWERKIKRRAQARCRHRVRQAAKRQYGSPWAVMAVQCRHLREDTRIASHSGPKGTEGSTGARERRG